MPRPQYRESTEWSSLPTPMFWHKVPHQYFSANTCNQIIRLYISVFTGIQHLHEIVPACEHMEAVRSRALSTRHLSTMLATAALKAVRRQAGCSPRPPCSPPSASQLGAASQAWWSSVPRGMLLCYLSERSFLGHDFMNAQGRSVLETRTRSSQHDVWCCCPTRSVLLSNKPLC
jgi:hypothetical protein